MTTNLMTYSARYDEYVGEATDGREVHVASGEISESQEMAATADGIDLDALFERDRATWQTLYDRYRDMQLNPDDWAGLDSDGNQQVKTFCARCGCHSAVAESYENGTADGCQCDCHEECIALGRESAGE